MRRFKRLPRQMQPLNCDNLFVESSVTKQRAPGNAQRLERMQADIRSINARLKAWEKAAHGVEARRVAALHRCVHRPIQHTADVHKVYLSHATLPSRQAALLLQAMWWRCVLRTHEATQVLLGVRRITDVWAQEATKSMPRMRRL